MPTDAYKRIHFLMVARIHVFNRAGILKLASASFSSKNWVPPCWHNSVIGRRREELGSPATCLAGAECTDMKKNHRNIAPALVLIPWPFHGQFSHKTHPAPCQASRSLPSRPAYPPRALDHPPTCSAPRARPALATCPHVSAIPPPAQCCPARRQPAMPCASPRVRFSPSRALAHSSARLLPRPRASAPILARPANCPAPAG